MYLRGDKKKSRYRKYLRQV